jgi:hypothetical protein
MAGKNLRRQAKKVREGKQKKFAKAIKESLRRQAKKVCDSKQKKVCEGYQDSSLVRKVIMT